MLYLRETSKVRNGLAMGLVIVSCLLVVACADPQRPSGFEAVHKAPTSFGYQTPKVPHLACQHRIDRCAVAKRSVVAEDRRATCVSAITQNRPLAGPSVDCIQWTVYGLPENASSRSPSVLVPRPSGAAGTPQLSCAG